MLYKIGDFSKETGVPIKTLRYYNEIDLFNPVEVNLFTGYRYYSSDQIEDLNLILKLKKVGFSLEEIKKYWNNFNNDIMLKKRDELIKNIDELKENIKKLEKEMKAAARDLQFERAAQLRDKKFKKSYY